MKLCEGFGTPIIADRIYDKHRLLSWVVFVLRKNIENIFLKPSWGSNQIKHVCVDRINAISIWYQFVCLHDIWACCSICLQHWQSFERTIARLNICFNCPLVFLFKYQILSFLVFWSYKLFFLSFRPKKLRSHNKRWVTTLQKGIFKYIRRK